MKYLSTKGFLDELKLKNEEGRKFCFIIGAGASVSSGIPSGWTLMNKWKKDIKEAAQDGDYSAEIKRRIKQVTNGDKSIEKEYINFLDPDYEIENKESLNDYNRLCELRFMDEDEERKTFFNMMEDKNPFIGYVALANVLVYKDKTDVPKHNIVISTNFDELIERAIEDFTNEKPFVIPCEQMAIYALESITKRPKILKVHRDIKTGVFNRTKYTNELKPEWIPPIREILKEYTPIVIGYAGSDHSLMDYLLTDDSRGIYWCHMYSDIPNDRVIKLVKRKRGCFVEIWEFDHIMCHIASILCDTKKFENQIIGDWKDKDFSGYFVYRSKWAVNEVKQIYNRKLKEIPSKYDQLFKERMTPISNNAITLAALGNIYNKTKQYNKASKAYGRAAEYESQSRKIYYGKAKYDKAVSLGKLNRNEEAEGEYRDLIESEFLDSGNMYIKSSALNNFAFTLIINKKYKEAYECVNDYINVHRRCDGNFYRTRGIANYYLGNYEDAVRDMNEALKCRVFERDSEQGFIPRELLYRGIIYYHMGLKDRAEKDFFRAHKKAAYFKGTEGTFKITEFFVKRCKNDPSITDEEIEKVFLMKPGEVINIYEPIDNNDNPK